MPVAPRDGRERSTLEGASHRGGNIVIVVHPVSSRRIGALYLLNAVSGFFSIMVVPHTLIVLGNAAATAHNILVSEMLFRPAVVSELFCVV